MSATEVLKVPKVTLYVKDADAPIWERARQLAGDSLSSVVSRALGAYVDEQEARARAESAIERNAQEITLDVEPDERPARKVRFTGVLAHEGDAGEGDAYVTTSGKIVLARLDGGCIENVVVFDSYEQFLHSNPSEEMGAAVAEKLGEEWIEEID